MPDRERRRWADSAPAAAVCPVSPSWRPAGGRVSRLYVDTDGGGGPDRRVVPPRGRGWMGLRHRFRANRARSFSILARFSGSADVSLTRWVSSRLFELRANSASFWGSDGTTSPFGTWPGCPVTISSLTY